MYNNIYILCIIHIYVRIDIMYTNRSCVFVWIHLHINIHSCVRPLTMGHVHKYTLCLSHYVASVRTLSLHGDNSHVPSVPTLTLHGDCTQSFNTNSKWDVGIIWICTEKFEFLDLVDLGGVAFSVETVMYSERDSVCIWSSRFGRFRGCSIFSGKYHA